MNIEELKQELKLTYTFGCHGKSGASRRYHDSNLNIGAETHTPKHKNGRWGKGKTIYYMENDKREFETIEELFEAFIETTIKEKRSE